MLFNEPRGIEVVADRLLIASPILDLPDEQTDQLIMNQLGLSKATLPYYQELYGETNPLCHMLYEGTLNDIFRRAHSVQSYPSIALANAMLDETNQGLTTLTDNTLIAMRVMFCARIADRHGIQLQTDLDLSDESIIKLMAGCAVLLPSVGQQLAGFAEYVEWRQAGQYAAQVLKSLISSVSAAFRTATAPSISQSRMGHAQPARARGLSVPAGMTRQASPRGLAFSGTPAVKKAASLASIASKTGAAGLSCPPEGGVVNKPAVPATRSSLLTQNLGRAVQAPVAAPKSESTAPAASVPEITSALEPDLRQEYLRRVISLVERNEAKKTPKGMTLAQISRRLTLDHIWSLLDVHKLKWAAEIPVEMFDVNAKECLLFAPNALSDNEKAFLILLNRNRNAMNPENYFTADQIGIDNIRAPRIRGTDALSSLANKKPAERRESPLIKINYVSETPLMSLTADEAMGVAQQYSRVCGVTICAQKYLAVDVVPLREGEMELLGQLRETQTIYDLHNSLTGAARSASASYLLPTVVRRLTQEINDFLKYGCGSKIRIDNFMHPSVQQLIKVVRQAKPLVGEALAAMQPTLISSALRSVNNELLRGLAENFPDESGADMVEKLFGDGEAADTRLGTGFINEGTMLYVDLTAIDIGLPLFIPTLNKREFRLELIEDGTAVPDSRQWAYWLSSLFGPLFTDEQGDHQLRVRLADGAEFMVRRTAIVLGDSRTLLFTAL